ncbi:MAG: SPL family radical SAM protein [Candidatus Rifleibacteriota bacterium]
MLSFPNLYIDEAVAELELTKSISSRVNFSRKIFVEGERHPGNGLLLTRNRGQFVKPCPGQKGSVCCGYWVVEWGIGCPFGCEYCIIQNYTGAGDVTLFVNWDDCQREIIDLRNRLSGPIRLGTGQFGDPLALEPIFPLNRQIIDWTRGFDNFTLEIKTKSANVETLLEAGKLPHVTLAFSLNPQKLIDFLEHGAASLDERLAAAAEAAAKTGCRLAFHFDPVIPCENWQEEYGKVFALMFEKLKNFRVNWISLGTFRFPHGFQEKVEVFHPDSPILTEEFYPSDDGKIRYFRPFREEIYRTLMPELQEFFPETAVYICMETPQLWERLKNNSFLSKDLKQLLDKRVK